MPILTWKYPSRPPRVREEGGVAVAEEGNSVAMSQAWARDLDRP